MKWIIRFPLLDLVNQVTWRNSLILTQICGLTRPGFNDAVVGTTNMFTPIASVQILEYLIIYTQVK